MHPDPAIRAATRWPARQATGPANRADAPPFSRWPARRGPGPVALALTLLLSALAACTGEDAASRESAAPADSAASRGPLSVVDGANRTVTLDAPARRIVSMMPSVTEWVIALDAADRLVARTDYDHHPAVDTLPSVGGGLTPSVEWLAARRPDLVVAWPDAPSRSLVARLEAMDIAVYAAPSETIEEGLETARDLGTLLARDSAAGTAIAEVEAGFEAVTAAVAGRGRPEVLFLIGMDPLMAAGPGTFVDQLLDRAGARNVLADMDILWPQLSLEEVVRRGPEIVIVGSATRAPLAALRGRPGWRSVPAVRTGRVHLVDPDLVNRPGPRMDEAAATLARLIHGRLTGLPGGGP
ncbi:MAG: helical backbone metal receptor [Longimicrobiales bacterium]